MSQPSIHKVLEHLRNMVDEREKAANKNLEFSEAEKMKMMEALAGGEHGFARTYAEICIIYRDAAAGLMQQKLRVVDIIQQVESALLSVKEAVTWSKTVDLNDKNVEQQKLEKIEEIKAKLEDLDRDLSIKAKLQLKRLKEEARLFLGRPLLTEPEGTSPDTSDETIAEFLEDVTRDLVIHVKKIVETRLIPPPVLWAQKNDVLYLRVGLDECNNPIIKLDKDSLYFRGREEGAENMESEVTLEFFKEINVEESKYIVKDCGAIFLLKKKESGSCWSRLLKDQQRHHRLIDLNKERDVDDSDDLEEMMKQMNGLYSTTYDLGDLTAEPVAKSKDLEIKALLLLKEAREKIGLIPPPVLWAQRNDVLFLKVGFEDCKNPIIKLDKDSLYFRGREEGTENVVFEVTLEFFKEVNVEESKYIVKDRGAAFVLKKKESGPYWSRLLKDQEWPLWLMIDYKKWRDEDDPKELKEMMKELGGLNSTTNDLGDLVGEADGDDEELPDLE